MERERRTEPNAGEVGNIWIMLIPTGGTGVVPLVAGYPYRGSEAFRVLPMGTYKDIGV